MTNRSPTRDGGEYPSSGGRHFAPAISDSARVRRLFGFSLRCPSAPAWAQANTPNAARLAAIRPPALLSVESQGVIRSLGHLSSYERQEISRAIPRALTTSKTQVSPVRLARFLRFEEQPARYLDALEAVDTSYDLPTHYALHQRLQRADLRAGMKAFLLRILPS